MLAKCSFSFVFIACVALLAAPVYADSPYAPLIDKSKVSKGYLQHKVQAAEKEIPNTSEVPIPAYKGAAIYQISNISSASDSKYQSNKIVFLASADSKDAVMNFYKSKFSGWKHDPLPNSASEYLLKDGNQRFWGGQKMLTGPRIEVIDLTHASIAQSADPGVQKLKEQFPGMKSVIKVSYEKSVEDLMAIDIDKVFGDCVQYEKKNKAKMGGQKSIPDAYLTKMAESTCGRVKKACAKNAKGASCQRYARSYG